jgi:stearoyl-CoA desaturase (delta-9 desaturase)
VGTVSKGARLRLIPPRRLRAGAVVDGVLLAAVHLGTVAALVRGGTARLVGLAAALYVARLALLAAGYGAGFARGAFRMGRATQLAIAVLGTTAGARGPLWWASHQRSVHADPGFEGCGLPRRALAWILLRSEEPRLDLVPDLAGYPELRFVDRWSRVGPFALAALLFTVGGLDALLWGGAVSTCLLLHTSTVIALLPPARGRLGSASASASGLW